MINNNMNEQIIYYLNKKILGEEYFISYEEYCIFENVNINITKENLELLFNNNNNLVLSQKQITLIKNDVSPFICEQNNFGTTARCLYGCLNHLEQIIDEIIILECDKEIIILECNKNILCYYNNFIFRKLGNELLKKYNCICNYSGNKYIIDSNKDTNEYVYFNSNFQTYIVSNNEEYGYHFYWMSDDNKNCDKNCDKNDNKIILELLQKKFPNLKFKINVSFSITTLYFIPLKKNYVKIFHMVKEYLDNLNIKVRHDVLVELD